MDFLLPLLQTQTDDPYVRQHGNYNERYNPEEAADDFEDQLIDAMTTPIKDEDICERGRSTYHSWTGRAWRRQD